MYHVIYSQPRTYGFLLNAGRYLLKAGPPTLKAARWTLNKTIPIAGKTWRSRPVTATRQWAFKHPYYSGGLGLLGYGFWKSGKRGTNV